MFRQFILPALAGSALIAATLPAAAATLTVVAENVNKAKGNIVVAVYQGDKFLSKKPEDRAHGAAVPAQKGPVTLVIENVEPGDYGLVVFHDANNNQDVDTNFIGMPKEGIGFSNGAKINMGPPKIDEARFTVAEPGATQSIELAY